MTVCPTCGHNTPSFYKPCVKERVLLYKKYHIDLSPQEARLMAALIRNYPHILEQEGIFNAIWPSYEVPDNAMRNIPTYIFQLRSKLCVSGLKIINQFDYGYRLEIED